MSVPIVYHNVLSQQELSTCLNIIDTKGWVFKGSSGVTARKFWYMELSDEQFFTQTVFDKVKALIGQDYEAEKIYANGQTFGLDGDFHRDGSDYTFVFFVSPIFRYNVKSVCGHTQFEVPGQEGLLSIEPIQNTGVFFPAKTLHRGTAPSRDSNLLRVTVAFKCKKLQLSI